MTKWLAEAAGESGGELIACRRDRELLAEKLLPQFNSSRSEDAKVALTDERADARGGFLFRTERFQVDKTVDSLVRGLREELTPEIAAELFG